MRSSGAHQRAGRGGDAPANGIDVLLAAFDDSPAAMVLYQPRTFRLLDVNAAATRAYGWTITSGEPALALDLVVPEDRADAVALLSSWGSGLRAAPWRVRRDDGGVAVVGLRSHVFCWAGGELAVLFAHDATDSYDRPARLRPGTHRGGIRTFATGGAAKGVDALREQHARAVILQRYGDFVHRQDRGRAAAGVDAWY